MPWQYVGTLRRLPSPLETVMTGRIPREPVSARCQRPPRQEFGNSRVSEATGETGLNGIQESKTEPVLPPLPLSVVFRGQVKSTTILHNYTN